MPETETATEKSTFDRLAPLVESSPIHLSAEEHLPPPVPCANCGSGLAGPYCAQCGQHVADYHRSVWRFVADFFDNTFCWDNKLFRTLGPLFRRPGFLTREYMAGRRVRYVHPLRLFLFTSAVCLTLLQFEYSHSFNIQTGSDQASKTKGIFDVDLSDAKPDAAIPALTTLPSGNGVAVAPSPSASASPDAAAAAEDKSVDALPQVSDRTKDKIKRALAKKRAAQARTRQGGKSAPDEMGDRIDRFLESKVAGAGGESRFNEALSNGVMQRLSWVALALLPVFALGLRAVYWRKDSYYFAHLVFSLHYHTFLLLFWTLIIAAQAVVNYLPLHTLFGWALSLAMLLPPLYLYLALRKMYGESARRTLVKVIALGAMHLLTIIGGVSAVGAYFIIAEPK